MRAKKLASSKFGRFNVNLNLEPGWFAIGFSVDRDIDDTWVCLHLPLIEVAVWWERCARAHLTLPSPRQFDQPGAGLP